MDSQQPYNGLSSSRLTVEINLTNHSQLVENTDFTFGPPEVYTDSAGRNTKVVITPVNLRKYRGPQELHYTRLPLTVLDDLPSGAVKSVKIETLPFSLASILTVINDALGLALLPEEIEDVTYSDRLSEYALPINDTVSLAWLTSGYQFKAYHEGDDVPLHNAIAVNILNGLAYLPSMTG